MDPCTVLIRFLISFASSPVYVDASGRFDGHREIIALEDRCQMEFSSVFKKPFSRLENGFSNALQVLGKQRRRECGRQHSP